MIQVPLRDGETLHVRSIGRGPTVVLLHGYASQSMHWLPNVLPLAHRFRFILPDLRGFGHSADAALNPDTVFRTYADDLHDVLDYFGVEKAILGGLSTGAYVALTYNLHYGFDRVSHYLNIEHCAQSKNDETWHHGLFGANQAEKFDLFECLLDDWHNVGRDRPFWDLPSKVRGRMANALIDMIQDSIRSPFGTHGASAARILTKTRLTRFVLPMDNWSTYIKVMEAFMIGNDTRPALGDIKVPTTLMMGAHSKLFPLQGQLDIAKHVRHARVVHFPNSGHVPNLDEPIAFQRELTRFLKDTQQPILEHTPLSAAALARQNTQLGNVSRGRAIVESIPTWELN